MSGPVIEAPTLPTDATRREPARPSGRGVAMAEALRQALFDAMGADERVVVYGEDVGRLGGVFRVTEGLMDHFGPTRCFDSPLAEAGIVGTAIGMALYGLRPVVELQFDGFSYPALNQVISHLAKLTSRSRGSVRLPVVLRIPYGGGIGSVEHHSESPETYYAHTAGLKVVTPGTVADAYGLLRAAIDSDDPVVFLEPKRRYWERDSLRLPVPPVPIGTAALRRSGGLVTLVAWGPTVKVALEAAEVARAEYAIDLEVLDLRSLVPLDTPALVASAARTGRVVVVHEAARFGGLGAEVAAEVQELAFGHLEAPVRRVTGYDVPYPPARLERWFLPDVDRVLDAVADLLEY